jgi:hypothetical protein
MEGPKNHSASAYPTCLFKVESRATRTLCKRSMRFDWSKHRARRIVLIIVLKRENRCSRLDWLEALMFHRGTHYFGRIVVSFFNEPGAELRNV